ncbi:MAG: UDP-N-acetylmuramoyl-L-alanyl-D-glutamate--2,6-diaminopimelate ligase [Planctomycetota bacterium]|nr:UDP-N-acetylmuramoyl-L-alanyl-D-glutamate--2,6-diaminopimelate ligase [Planctomycetota bacterium]
MLLKELLAHVDTIVPPQVGDIEISGIACDSREVKGGELFIAVMGSRIDGTAYVPDALAKGAAAVIAERRVETGVPCIVARDSRKALWQAAKTFYGDPQKELKVIGVTGTNGKTTCVSLITNVLREAGHQTAMLGTIRYEVGGEQLPSHLTTPGPLELYSLMRKMLDAGDEYLVMEVSSHALAQQRVCGIRFDGAIFTNISRDHLDYHPSMEHYASSKARLLAALKPSGVAAVNFRDEFGEFVSRSVSGRVIPFGFRGPVRLDEVSFDEEGTTFSLRYGERRTRLRTRLVGRFNAENVLAVATLCYGIGIELATFKAAIEGAPCVPGRLERITDLMPRVFVDYAHTDDALDNALSALKELPHEKLRVVFGCGGDRDSGKRPVMGKVAEKHADVLYVTSDNPRSEDPQHIISQILEGIELDNKSVNVIPDRAEAIGAAVVEAHEKDIVLVAGKGHEDYQIIGDKVVPFDDRKVTREILTKGADHG